MTPFPDFATGESWNEGKFSALSFYHYGLGACRRRLSLCAAQSEDKDGVSLPGPVKQQYEQQQHWHTSDVLMMRALRVARNAFAPKVARSKAPCQSRRRQDRAAALMACRTFADRRLAGWGCCRAHRRRNFTAGAWSTGSYLSSHLCDMVDHRVAWGQHTEGNCWPFGSCCGNQSTN